MITLLIALIDAHYKMGTGFLYIGTVLIDMYSIEALYHTFGKKDES